MQTERHALTYVRFSHILTKLMWFNEQDRENEIKRDRKSAAAKPW